MFMGSRTQAGQRFRGAELTLQVAFENLDGETAEILGTAAGPWLRSHCRGRGAQNAKGKLPRIGGKGTGRAVAVDQAKQSIGMRVVADFPGPKRFAARRAVGD